MSDPLDLSLDLLRRLNPKNVSSNLTELCKLSPSVAEDLLSSVDQPLGVKICKKTNQKYLTCDYNRDGDSYRSPWSGEYDPYISDGPVPSASLRELEVLANNSFDVYRDLYYEGGISSVYLWDQDDGFAGVFLLKNSDKSASSSHSGAWDSIHVFEVVEIAGKKSAEYRLTSTVMLDVTTSTIGSLDLSGSLTRQVEKVLPVGDQASHIINIGSLVEEMESRMRNVLDKVYFGKTRDIVGDLRSVITLSEVAEERELQGEVAKDLGA